MTFRQLNNEDLYNKNVIVNKLLDLPTAVGGKISLLPGVKYTFGSPINIGTDYLEIGDNTILDSISKSLTTITYTGTGSAIRGTNISCTLREINVTGAPQGFEFNGSGIEGVNIFQSNFQGCTKTGTVDSLYFFNLSNSTFILNTDGITMINCDFIDINNTNWFGDNSGTYLHIPSGTFKSIKISNNNLEVNTGNIGIDIVETNIIHTQKVEIISNILVGNSSTYYINFNPLDGNFISLSNIGIINNESFEFITTNDMFLINNPKISVPLFNTTLNEIVYWNGSVWVAINGTIIFNEVLIDDFESGSFATKGWVTVQGGENDWYVGTDNTLDGTNSAYISNNDGVSNAYSSNGGALDVSHVYLDILMPSATTNLILQFDWLCEAEVGFDYGQVHDVTTSTIPEANTELGSTGLIGLNQYNNQSIKTTEQITLPISEAGTTRRIVFSWRNDSSVENQPPFNIDNIKIKYL